MRGGKRPGAGRPKGARDGSETKKDIRRAMTARLVDEALAHGPMPLEVMLSAMRECWLEGDKKLAAEFAKDAAPYCHPRLAAVEHSGKMTVTHDDALNEIEERIGDAESESVETYTH